MGCGKLESASLHSAGSRIKGTLDTGCSKHAVDDKHEHVNTIDFQLFS